MTQEQIDDLNNSYKAFSEARKATDILQTVWQEKSAAMVKVCDHAKPDGTSAWESLFIYDMCTICGMWG